VTDWLGVEKARDMAKILGTAVDEKDTGDKQDTADLMKDGSPESAAAAGEPSAGLTDNVRATHRNYAALESESESESDDEPGFGEFEVLPPSKQARKEKTASSILPARAYSIVYYKIATLRVATMSIWLSMEQIIWIVKSFPTDDFCRVYVAILLHARCIDMKNYWQIFTILEPQEQLEVLHRLGWLNTQNPVHPERIYVLDLRSWEHREMCKILVKLAVEEPGTNWMDEAYRWSIFDVPVPGWELPISWSTEDYELNGEGGPRRFGRLQLKYTSDPKLGCDPQWEYRTVSARRLALLLAILLVFAAGHTFSRGSPLGSTWALLNAIVIAGSEMAAPTLDDRTMFRRCISVLQEENHPWQPRAVSELKKIVHPGQAGIYKGCIPLLAALVRGQADSSVKSDAAWVLVTLSDDDDAKVLIVKSGLIDDLVAMARDGPEANYKLAAMTLAPLTMPQQSNEAVDLRLNLMAAGAVKALVAIVGGDAGQYAKREAARGLANLALVPRNIAAIVAANGIEPLVDMLRSDEIISERKLDAARALQNIAEESDARAVIVAAGALAPLRRLADSANRETRFHASATLFSLGKVK
jgi:hypothetical protein